MSLEDAVEEQAKIIEAVKGAKGFQTQNRVSMPNETQPPPIMPKVQSAGSIPPLAPRDLEPTNYPHVTVPTSPTRDGPALPPPRGGQPQQPPQPQALPLPPRGGATTQEPALPLPPRGATMAQTSPTNPNNVPLPPRGATMPQIVSGPVNPVPLPPRGGAPVPTGNDLPLPPRGATMSQINSQPNQQINQPALPPARQNSQPTIANPVPLPPRQQPIPYDDVATTAAPQPLATPPLPLPPRGGSIQGQPQPQQPPLPPQPAFNAAPLPPRGGSIQGQPQQQPTVNQAPLPPRGGSIQGPSQPQLPSQQINPAPLPPRGGSIQQPPQPTVNQAPLPPRGGSIQGQPQPQPPPPQPLDAEAIAHAMIHVNLSRPDAEVLLIQKAALLPPDKQVGLYLIRSKENAVVFSMFGSGKVFHYQFTNQNGRYINEKGRDLGPLSHVIAHYQTNKEAMCSKLGNCVGPRV